MVCIFTLDRLVKDHGFCPDFQQPVSHSNISGLVLAAGASTEQMRRGEVVSYLSRYLSHQKSVLPPQEASVKAIELNSTVVAV